VSSPRPNTRGVEAFTRFSRQPNSPHDAPASGTGAGPRARQYHNGSAEQNEVETGIARASRPHRPAAAMEA